MDGKKVGALMGIVILSRMVSAQSQAALGDLVIKLLCFLLFVFPAIMTLLLIVGGFLILRGGQERRISGKKLLANTLVAFLILIFLAWIVTLTSPELDFNDYGTCLVGGEPPTFPVTTTLLGNQAPWADARGSAYAPPPLPEEKEIYCAPGSTVYFDGSRSIDFDGQTVRYEWDLGDGSSQTGVAPSNLYPNEGVYTVELTVTDNDDLSDFDVIKVYLKPLEAHILQPANEQVFIQAPGEEINFTGLGGYGSPCAPPNPRYTYQWKSNVSGSLSTEPSFVVEVASLPLGPHRINLTVTDCDGNTASATVTIYIDLPLFAEILTTINDGDILECSDTLEGKVSGGTPPHEVTWQAAGQIFDSGIIADADGTHKTARRPSPVGVYDIIFEVTDKYGLRANDVKRDIEVIVCNPCDVYKSSGILPDEFDWRNYNEENYLTPVRDQGQCGSCWAYSALGAMEGTYKVEQGDSGTNPDLSEQDLVSCSSAGNCAVGGWPHKAFSYIKGSKVVDENCFPYVAADIACSKCSAYSSKQWTINNYGKVSNSINKIQEALICHGPLSVASMNWMHAITLVGYGNNDPICQSKYGKGGCWIIKNSWGVFTQVRYGVYHENGYGYIPYSGHSKSDIKNYVYYVGGVSAP